MGGTAVEAQTCSPHCESTRSSIPLHNCPHTVALGEVVSEGPQRERNGCPEVPCGPSLGTGLGSQRGALEQLSTPARRSQSDSTLRARHPRNHRTNVRSQRTRCNAGLILVVLHGETSHLQAIFCPAGLVDSLIHERDGRAGGLDMTGREALLAAMRTLEQVAPEDECQPFCTLLAAWIKTTLDPAIPSDRGERL